MYVVSVAEVPMALDGLIKAVPFNKYSITSVSFHSYEKVADGSPDPLVSEP